MNKKLFFVFLVALVMGSTSALANESFEAPVPVRMVPPKYPQDMRRDGTSGIVTVKCLIDEKGNVTETSVERASNDAFIQPALEALRKWKFKPAKRGGNPVALHVSIPIQFNLNTD
ncbi:MAG: energy transducer TonB [Candidatus Didemnitutus sp.]|nr:energy transducer TonB [Candidatus Didemnitutus sp.]